MSTNPAYQEIVALIEQQEWEKARALAHQVGNRALSREKFALARNVGGILERLEDHQFAARLTSVSIRQLKAASSPLPEWDGSDLADRTLIIVCRNTHIAPATLRLGRLIGLVAHRAKRCIALIEPRLVPLIRRSFPGVDVRDATTEEARAYAEADVVAGYETLLHFAGFDANGQLTRLPSHTPDPTAAAAFREKYGAGPLIGISWYSTNDKKDVPNIEEWGALLSRLDATFVSIQYGDVRESVERLRHLSGKNIILDDSVDAWNALDLLAAQVASLDAVITISNTGAHTAGALGIPMFVLLDDKDHLSWPFEGRTTAWYPSATLYRKAKRTWPEVLVEVGADIERKLGSGGERESRQTSSNWLGGLLGRKR